MINFLHFIVLSILLFFAEASDRVSSIPGAPKFTFPIYSGTFPVNKEGDSFLYYFFAASKGNPLTDPVREAFLVISLTCA